MPQFSVLVLKKQLAKKKEVMINRKHDRAQNITNTHISLFWSL